MIMLYYSDSVRDRAKKYNLTGSLAKLEERLESVEVENIHPSVMERIGPLLFKRQESNFRIIGGLRLIGEKKIPVIIILEIFVRGDKQYENFINWTRDKQEKWAERNMPDVSEVEKFVEEKLQNSERINTESGKEDLPDTLAKWLLPFSPSKGETMVFESRVWVERFEEEEFKNLSHRYYDILFRIVSPGGNSANSSGWDEDKVVETNEILRFCGNEHGIVYYLRFLIGIPQHPAEEIVFLVDAARRRDFDLEKKLRDGLLKGEGEFRWIKELSEGIITEEYQVDMISRQTGRAYYAYILADESLWRFVERVNVNRMVEDGVDRTNPALSVEELCVLNQARHSSTRVVLPLFINGRAGSGKSTMLYHLFASYLSRKLYDKLPGNLLFLTYTRRLLEDAKQTVKDLLRVGSSFAGASISELELAKLIEETFWVFPEFLLSLVPQEERLKRFPRESFVANFGEFCKIYDEIVPVNDPRCCSADVAWHVIRTYIKGYRPDIELSPEGYEELPKKERTVPIDLYKWVWNRIWPKYRENYWDTQDVARYLLKNDLVEASYAVVFCDEAQDFTKVEFQLLWKLLIYRKYDLKKQGVNLRIPLVLAGDPLQTLNPTGFRWEALKAAFYNEIIDAFDQENLGLVGFNFKELTYNYRSTRPIVGFSNFLQLWRKQLFGLKEEVLQDVWREEHILPPRLYVLGKSISEETLKDCLENQVVILPCEYGQEKEFVQKDFLLSCLDESPHKPSFLSPMAAKGLEFTRVWLYRFGDYCPDSLKRVLSQQKDNLEYDDILRSEYFLNKLYVAVTRARDDLILIDTDRGRQILWDVVMNLNFDTDQVVENITLGDHYGLNFDHMDPLEMARQLSQKDDPKLLRQASDFYRRAGRKNEAKYCEARALELERNYRQAGVYYLELNDLKYFEAAERCFWKSGSWDMLSKLYTSYWQNGGNPFYRCSTQIMSYQNAQDKISVDELKDFVDKLEATLGSSLPLLDEKASQEVINFVFSLLLERFKQSEEVYKGILIDATNLITAYPVISFVVGYDKAAWICYCAGELQKALKYWEKVDRKPREYYLIRAQLASRLGEKLHWLYQAGAYKDIITLVSLKSYTELQNLSESDIRLVKDSYIRLEHYEEAIEWLKNCGKLQEAFDIIEYYWNDLDDKQQILISFFEQVVNALPANPFSDFISFGKIVYGFFRQNLAWDHRKELTRVYWEALAEVDEWETIVEDVNKIENAYRMSAAIMMARIIAEKLTFQRVNLNPKTREKLSWFLNQYFMRKVDINSIRPHLKVLSAAVEKVCKFLDVLEWYEKLLALESIDGETERFIRLRWLKTKQQRIDYLERNKEKLEKIKKEREDFRRQLKLWQFSESDIQEKTEYPYPFEESQENVQVRVEWDGENCKLTLGDQLVLINVFKLLISGFKIEIEEHESDDGVSFTIKDWELSGIITKTGELSLYLNGKPWRVFRA